MKDILRKIVSNTTLHQRWLFTLSYLENSGAKKIIHLQKFKFPPLSVLKHAHEEARHAYFFRKQIALLGGDPDQVMPLLGGIQTKNILNKLDVKIMQTLRQSIIPKREDLYYFSYLLTTYAIEVRADIIFHLYEDILRERNLDITLIPLIKEEANHLREIEQELTKWEFLSPFKKLSCDLENKIFQEFMTGVEREIIGRSG